MKGNIYIPEPCHENWNKMSPTEKGRHCEVCSKVVTDFSKMNKNEILTTLQKSKEELCGHIPMDQLTPANKRQKIYFWFKGSFIPKLNYVVFGILGLTVLFKKSAFSQTIENREVMVNGGLRAPVLEPKKVNVVVVDEHNNPVKDATVNIKINDVIVNTAVTTDKGECSTMVDIESYGYSLIDIEVNAYGYKQKIVKQVRFSKDNQTYRVKMDEEVIVLGKMIKYTEPEVNIVTVDTAKNKEETITCENTTIVFISPATDLIIDDKLEPADTIRPNIFDPQLELNDKILSFISFPNPTMGNITIETKQDISFAVWIYNELGAIILQENDQYKRTSISLNGNPAGTYYAILFINNKAIETHKIILVR